jgi:hypothetical protein
MENRKSGHGDEQKNGDDEGTWTSMSMGFPKTLQA